MVITTIVGRLRLLPLSLSLILPLLLATTIALAQQGGASGGWPPGSTGGVGVGASNVTATCAGTVTTCPVTVTSLALTSATATTAIEKCYVLSTGAELTITAGAFSGGPPYTTYTPTFTSTTGVYCTVNSNGGAGATGATGATGPTGPAGPTGPGYSPATSTSSVAIAIGPATFTVQSGLAYQAGGRARATYTSNTADYMEGTVTSYSGTTLVISVDTTGNSGTFASWNINAAGIPGLTGPTGPTGATGATGANGAGNNTYCPDASGSTTTYTCPTPNPSVSTLTGLLISFVPQTTNTGTSTVNVSSLGANTLKQSDCATNVASGALVGGTTYLFAYNGTYFCQASSSSSPTQYQSNGTNVGSPASTFNVAPGTCITTPMSQAGGVVLLTPTLDTACAPTKANLQTGTAPTTITSASGSNTHYTAAGTPTFTTYSTGMSLRWTIDTTNTCTSTCDLNLDTLGAKGVFNYKGNNLAAGDLQAGSVYTISYNGTIFLCAECGVGTSSGVSSVSGTAPIVSSGGSTPAISCATCVTSAAALTSNAVVIGGGLQASSTISTDTTTTHALFATAGAPAFRAIASGDLPTLPVSIGGLGAAVSPAAGSMLYASSTTVFAPLATTAYSVMISGATNPAWSTPTGNGQCFMSGVSSYATTTPSFQTCPSGGSPAFSSITSATNTTAAMVVGSGATLGVSGTGTIAATSVPLSGLTASGAATTIANGDNPFLWNSATTTSGRVALTIGETTASTSAGTPYNVLIKTLIGSTATPLNVANSLNGTQTLPALSITPTWNTTGVVDAALLINATNTASGAASKLIDAQVGAASQFSVDKAGNTVQTGGATSGSGSGKTGYYSWIGATSGAEGFTVSDVAGTSTLYIIPAAVGGANHFFSDSGTGTCPTLPSGAPAACEQTAWVASVGSGSVLLGTPATGQSPNGSTGAYTATPALGTDNSVAGTFQLANGFANAHTIWSSGATTTNTIQGFAAVPTTGHLLDCTVTSTTCLMHDSGVVTANVVNASSPGAGVAHFAGSTQTVTSSSIVNADIAASTIDLTAKVTGVLPSANGGTGVNNTATLTLGTSNHNYATLGTGIIKNTTTTGALTNAASADIYNLFTSCTGSSGLFLKDGGTCAAAGGTPSFPVTVAGTVTSGGIPYFSSTTVETSSALLTQYGVLFGGGAGGAPTASAQGAANMPMIGQGAANPIFSTIAYPTALTSGGILYASSTTAIASSGALTVNVLPKGGGAGAAPTNSSITDNGTTVATTETVSIGTSPPACTAGTAGGLCFTEGTAITNVSGAGALDANSTTHELEYQSNGSALKGMMVRAQPGSIRSTGLVASVSTATLCAASAGACNTAGTYHVHLALYQSGAACSANTTNGVSVQLTWTDANSTAHTAQTIPLETNASLVALSGTMAWGATTVNAYGSGDFNVDTNGSIIQYATTFAQCTTGTATYALSAVVTRLQ